MEWKGDGWRCTIAYRVDRGCLLIICYASRRVARDCYRPRSRLGTEMDTEEREPIGRLDVEELGVERIQAWLSIEETRFPGSIVGGRSWMRWNLGLLVKSESLW